MQSSDNVQLRDADFQGFARFLHYFIHRKLETVGVAFLARKRTELARQNAIVRIVDIPIDDIAGAVAHFALPDEIRDCPEGVQVPGFKQAQRVGFGNALAGNDFVVNVAQIALLNEKIHL